MLTEIAAGVGPGSGAGAAARAAFTGPWPAMSGAVAGPRPAGDGGVGVLLGLLGPRLPAPVHAALLAGWLAGLRDGPACGGLFGGGLAGRAVGLAYAAGADPRLRGLAARQRAALLDWIRTSPWRANRVGWSDYDLMTGPAGVLLGLASLPPADLSGLAAPGPVDLPGPPPADPADPSGSPGPSGLPEPPGLGEPAGIRSLARHLGALVGVADRLRVRRHAGDGRAAQLGHVDYGLAHGLAGVVAALTAAGRLLPGEPPAPLRHAAHRLSEASYVDSRRVLTWPPSTAGRPEPARRQAWCYGTPGVAWAIWDAGQLLGDPELTGVGAAAMASLCAAWDDDRYLYGDQPADRLGICHGLAGVLAIADAFARHAGHEPAARLRAHLLGRTDAGSIVDLGRADLTMLTGAAGVLAVLATVDGGQRGWLPLLGLR